MAAEQRIINKGIQARIRVHGAGLVEGATYAAVLYYSPKHTDFRAMQTAIAQKIGEDIVCLFDFTPGQTATLKSGNVIFEVYDVNTQQQMTYNDHFATVRATSLSN